MKILAGLSLIGIMLSIGCVHSRAQTGTPLTTPINIVPSAGTSPTTVYKGTSATATNPCPANWATPGHPAFCLSPSNFWLEDLGDGKGYQDIRLQGPIGPPGVNGTNGTNGKDGQPGVSGPSGANGKDGAIGVAGPVGPSGTNGKDGVSGPQGIAGVKGADGITGAQGVKGDKGDQGPVGATGPSGISPSTMTCTITAISLQSPNPVVSMSCK